MSNNLQNIPVEIKPDPPYVIAAPCSYGRGCYQQKDMQGHLLFLHRTNNKFRIGSQGFSSHQVQGETKREPPFFPMEAKAWEFFEELKCALS